MKKYFFVLYKQGRRHRGGRGRGAIAPTIFCNKKKKKGNKEKKERVSKQKLLKGCHQSQNVTVLVMFTVLF